MFDFIKNLFKKPPVNYATAELIENVVPPSLPGGSPLRDKKLSYIKHIGRLKQSLVSGNIKVQRMSEKYLLSQGFVVPETLSDCDKLIREIESWQ